MWNKNGTLTFQPRNYQIPLVRAFDEGKRRIYCRWHRRAGKDLLLWNLMAREAGTKPGIYYYLLPTYKEAKRIIWDGMTNDGQKFLDFIPAELIEKRNEQEMKLTFVNGSIIQLIGTDQYDSIRGSNPRGCVFSEFGWHNPGAWRVVEPIIRGNGGWAIFNTTPPETKNESVRMWNAVKGSPDWFTQQLTINDTKLLDWDAIVREAQQQGNFDEAHLQREYLCLDIVGGKGSIYGTLMEEARRLGRVGNEVIFDKALKVYVSFDLGRTDATAMIFFQKVGKEIHIIDFYQNTGHAVDHYIGRLREKNYPYAELFLPHDAFAKRLEHPLSVAEQLEQAGFKTKRVMNHEILHGIQYARKDFGRLWFDNEKTKELVEALEAYHWKYDENRKVESRIPDHDWASHPSDSLRYLFMGLEEWHGQTTDREYEESARQLAGNPDPYGGLRKSLGVPFQDMEFQKAQQFNALMEYENAARQLIDF